MESPAPERRTTARRGFRRTYRIAGSVLLALTIGAATLTLVLVERWEAVAGAPAGLDGAGDGRGADSPFTATMYYVAADGLGLVRREIEVPYAADTLSRARIIVERQLERARGVCCPRFRKGRACGRCIWPATATSSST